MAINFKIPNPAQKVSGETLAKGFGLPIVKKAFIVSGAVKADKPDATSLLGTPLYGTLFITSPKWEEYVYDDNRQEYSIVTKTIGGNKRVGGIDGCFIEGAIIEVSQIRNIVTTSISGMDGTVKEFINNGDYQVSIRGYFATKDPDVYPAFDVTVLSDILKCPNSLDVTSVFLNDYFRIYNLVPVSYSFHQQEGMRNVQFFEIQCLSDIAYEIKENSIDA